MKLYFNWIFLTTFCVITTICETEGYNQTNDPCWNHGGNCLPWYKCVRKLRLDGMCPGQENSIPMHKCCIPNPYSFYCPGKCQRSDLSCPDGGYIERLCGNQPSNVKCCIKKTDLAESDTILKLRTDHWLCKKRPVFARHTLKIDCRNLQPVPMSDSSASPDSESDQTTTTQETYISSPTEEQTPSETETAENETTASLLDETTAIISAENETTTLESNDTVVSATEESATTLSDEADTTTMPMVTASESQSDMDEPCWTRGGNCMSRHKCTLRAKLEGECPKHQSLSTDCCLPYQERFCPGMCQRSDSSCSGGIYIDKLCPSQPENVKCCVKRKGTTESDDMLKSWVNQWLCKVRPLFASASKINCIRDVNVHTDQL